MLRWITFLVLIPALTIFLALTSIPTEVAWALLIVGCIVFVLPTLMAEIKFGMPAAMGITFLLIVGVCWWIYTVYTPTPTFSHPIIDFIAGILNPDMIPVGVLKGTVAIIVGCCLGVDSTYFGNVLSEKATVIWRT